MYDIGVIYIASMILLGIILIVEHYYKKIKK